MKTKNIIMGVLIAITFFIAGMGYVLVCEKQSTAVLSQSKHAGLTTMHLHKGGDVLAGEDDIILDKSGSITRRRVSYKNGTSTVLITTGTLDPYRRQVLIEATLSQMNATTIKSDPTPGPDMGQSILDYATLNGENYHLQCVASQGNCSKLTEALFADFDSIFAHQSAGNK